MRYLITGGAGFIGSHLADALLGSGHQVAILDDLSTGQRTNVEASAARGPVEFVEGSVTDGELVNALMRECDCCLHLASAVGVKLVVAQPLETLRRIVRGTDTVISSAAENGKRVLFASTSEVYGKNSGAALNEDSDRVIGSASKSRWSYAIAKSYGEALAHSYHRECAADTVVFRLFNTIGPRQTGAYGMVVPRFARQALLGEDVTVYGDGTQSRCFLHVQDAVRGIISLAEHDGATGRSFNIGASESITVRGLARRVVERADSRSKIRYVRYEDAYDEGFEELGRRKPDTSAIQSLTGWRAERTLDEAIDEVIAFQRAELAEAFRSRASRTSRAVAVPARG
jgi:UDP-glucose 4-epimerase